jgi:hypothetical protein
MDAKKLVDGQLQAALCNYAANNSARAGHSIMRLRKRIINGKATTGDLARDLVFAHLGTIDDKIEAPIKSILIDARANSLFLMTVQGPMTQVSMNGLNRDTNEIVSISGLVTDRDFRPAAQAQHTDLFHKLTILGYMIADPRINMASGIIELPFSHSYTVMGVFGKGPIMRSTGTVTIDWMTFMNHSGRRTVQMLPAQDMTHVRTYSGSTLDTYLRKDNDRKGFYYYALTDLGILPPHDFLMEKDKRLTDKRNEVYSQIEHTFRAEQELLEKAGRTYGAVNTSVIGSLNKTRTRLQQLLKQAVYLGLDERDSLPENPDAYRKVISLCRDHLVPRVKEKSLSPSIAAQCYTD